MVNSVPPMGSDDLASFVASLSDVAEHLFITSSREDFYESFADGWVEFVKSVPG